MAVDACKSATPTPSTTTAAAAGSCCASSSGSSTTSESPSPFTDSEWEAARELLRLGGALHPVVAPRPLPSSAGKAPAECPGSQRRRQRQRSLESIYIATSPVAGSTGGGGGRQGKRGGACDGWRENKRGRTRGGSLLPLALQIKIVSSSR